MNEYTETNKRLWNEYVGIHTKSAFYDLPGFKAGRSSLDEIEREGLQDVAGKSLLHLQCHFGMDTLSWARLGAEVTGADFSEEAITFARSLSEELDIPAEFVCSDLYELPDKLDKQFDIVFTSYGVLTWLADIQRWGEIVGRFLKPGGVFYIVEFHPFKMVFDDRDGTTELRVYYPYFEEKVFRYDDTRSYADGSVELENTVAYEWMYRMGDIITSLATAGLRIEYMKEYPHTCEQCFPFLVQGDDGQWRLPDEDDGSIPLLFALRAVKV
ncbi:MAG: class I SAM-dependent methyltransferase [bacterium]|nr:class I SAM-dependent methyltransferase [bacterium]